MSRFALIIAWLLSASTARAEDWPQFLGTRRDGSVIEQDLHLDWKNRKPQVLWKAPIGESLSSVSVVGSRLYTTAKRQTRDHVVCLDARDGTVQWSYDAAPTYLDAQKHGYGPRGTPTWHDAKLYCLLPMGELLCLTDAGKRVWKVDIFESTGAANPHGEFYYWGLSLSPLVEGDLVIVQPGGDKGNSVAAFDRNTGKLVWKSGSDATGYSSPIAVTIDEQRQLIVGTGQSVLGLEPKSGRVLWRYAFGNRFNATCATPVWSGNRLFVSAAYGAGCASLEIVRDGKQWSVREKWRKKDMQNLFATSIVHEGHIYGCHGDLGAIFLKCLDLQTGAVQWEERQRIGRATLLRIQDHLLLQGERGTLQVIEATPKGYRVKGEMANVLAFKAWSTPAIANRRLYVRDQKQVVCFDLK